MASPKQPSVAQMKKALTQFRKGTKVKERVYHGTSNLEGLASFDPKLTGKGTDQLGSGFYFTTHPDEASGYASMPDHPNYPKPGSGTSPGMVAAHLAIRKPIKIGPKGSSLNDARINLSPDEVRRIMEHAPNIRHPEESPLNDHFDTSQGVTPRMISDVAKLYAGKGTLHMLENDMFRGDPTSYRHALRNVLGYDGVMKDFGDGRKHYVAWFPEQVKSAIGNRGTYDPTNPDITMAQGGTVNAFDYENPEHVENVAHIAAKHPDFNKIPDVAKHLAGSLSQGGYKIVEDPRIQHAIKQAGHQGYFVREKAGKQQHVIKKAMGGVVPSVEQMRNELTDKTRFAGLGQLQSIGANEAPSLGVKTYVPPTGRPDNNQIPVGGIDTHYGDLPVGGIDMNQQQAGQQLQPTPAGQQPGMDQVPQGDKTNILDGTGTPPGPNTNPPPGMPGGSNILQMTPQGQAMSAMKPQGLAKGGQPNKPLHYEPSPALMKAEIEAYAERMARQMSGLDNPNEKTLQQLAREQNLPLDIRKGGKKQDVPVINWEQQKGAYSIGVPGDPSRGGLVPVSRNKKRMGLDMPKAGEYLHAIGGEKLESPVPLYGGKDYGAYGHPEGWASDLGASAGMFNVVKRLAEEDPSRKILGHYHKMSPVSLNHAVHMMDAVLSYHQPHKSEPERIAMLNHLMRNVKTTTEKSDVPYPEFPGFENPNDVMFHGSLNSGMRKKIINLLGKNKHFPGGKQKLQDLQYAVSHPELRNIEAGAGGSSILEFDPSRELRSTVSSHPTYGHDIPSKLVGRTKYIVPADILAPRSMHNARKEIAAMGKAVVPFNQAKMNIIREPIDEQYINQMGEYENAMRKRLGYKKGGGVKLHSDQDTMALELSRKPKKAK